MRFWERWGLGGSRASVVLSQVNIPTSSTTAGRPAITHQEQIHVEQRLRKRKRLSKERVRDPLKSTPSLVHRVLHAALAHEFVPFYQEHVSTDSSKSHSVQKGKHDGDHPRGFEDMRSSRPESQDNKQQNKRNNVQFPDDVFLLFRSRLCRV